MDEASKRKERQSQAEDDDTETKGPKADVTIGPQKASRKNISIMNFADQMVLFKHHVNFLALQPHLTSSLYDLFRK
ncbi:hypothetical protein AAES_89171 [Amazona aestiva]|uniref:Uncharacterized protein n=1 Tax=Amazona aestiva TaxID=12930 RepID=A0A0Q3TJR6_AMAAE|nr:hypothetical protein AAES_89171 [Amazona aestiva]